MSSPRQAFVQLVFNLPVRGPFTYRVPEELGVVPGQRVMAPFGKRKLLGYAVGLLDSAPPELREVKEIIRVVDDAPLLTPTLLTLGEWIADSYLCSPGEAYATMLPSGREERDLDVPDVGASEGAAGPLVLSGEQEAALAAILGATPPCTHYLHGVTGSGKTEVYIRAALSALGEGRGVICLVPEISLTHQAVERFAAAVGAERVAVLHSGLTASERLTEWRRLLDGRARVAIGARSAVFAPIRDLGLIVVDEEQEGAYKSSSVPRYHARQVAMQRARVEGCRLVLGSATPSVEAYHYMGTGAISRLGLVERPAGGSMPRVSVVDMRREDGPLSRALVDAMRRVHASGGQSILFLNHRGFSYFFHCRSCDYEMRCKHCSVSLTYHKGRGQMVCHYCGFRAAPLTVCPACGSLDVGYSGFGTEAIEEDIARRLPDLVVRRLDTDVTRRRGELARALGAFREGKVHALLGTQMVAKGLDFPGVKLVGIVLADVGLQFPDFRAAERTFSLIVQVAGRAGRATPDGQVIVQTYRPNHEAIRLAAAGDLATFYKNELALRKELLFPPFSRLVRLVFRGEREEVVLAAAEEIGRALEGELRGKGEVLGPAECPLAVVAGKHRHHLIVRAAQLRPLVAAVRRALASRRPVTGLSIDVDADPVDLL